MLGLIIFFVSSLRKQIKEDKVFAFFAMLIVAGGLYHLGERLLTKCVFDYLKIGSIVFNLVDVLIVGSAIFLILYTYARKESNSAH